MKEIIAGLGLAQIDPRWTSAPAVHTQGYFPVFSRVSLALQIAMRSMIPAAYFQNSGNFRDLKSAFAMLAYEASRPLRPRVTTQMSHDVLDPAMPSRLLLGARGRIARALRSMRPRLLAEGPAELADVYAPREAREILRLVRKSAAHRRWLFFLVRAEGAMLDALQELAGIGRLSLKAQRLRHAAFAQTWRRELRRMCPGQDFTALAPALLRAAGGGLSEEDGPRLVGRVGRANRP